MTENESLHSGSGWEPPFGEGGFAQDRTGQRPDFDCDGGQLPGDQDGGQSGGTASGGTDDSTGNG